jgi:hypothetical protein
MVTKILKSGYCNLMMAYYVDYIDDLAGKTRTYFDYVHERNKFIADNK